MFHITPVLGVVYWAFALKNNRREAKWSSNFFMVGLFLRANIGNATMIECKNVSPKWGEFGCVIIIMSY